jgi:hypothetical protein
MIGAHEQSGVATPAASVKPRRPRRDALTYTFAELCYVVGLSARQLRRKRHLFPAPFPWSKRPLWSREIIAEWLRDGAKARR